MKKRLFSVLFVFILLIALTITALAQETTKKPQITAVWSDKDSYKVGEEVTIYANIKYEDGTPFVVETGKSEATFTFTNVEGEWKLLIPYTTLTYDSSKMYYVGKASAPNMASVRVLVDANYGGVVEGTWVGGVRYSDYTFKVVDATETVKAPEVRIADVWSDKPYYKAGEEVIVYAKVIDKNGEPATPEKGYFVSFGIADFNWQSIGEPAIGFDIKYNPTTAYWEAKVGAPNVSPVRVPVTVINKESGAQLAQNKDFYFKVEGVEQEEVIEPVEKPEVVTNPCAKLWTECRARVMKELGYVEGEGRTGEEEVKLRTKISEECSPTQLKCIEERCVPIGKYKACITELSAIEVIEKSDYENKCGIPCPQVEEVEAGKKEHMTGAEAERAVECMQKVIGPEKAQELIGTKEAPGKCALEALELPESERTRDRMAVYYYRCLAKELPDMTKELKSCMPEAKPVVIEEIPKRAEKAAGFLNCFSKVLKTELTEEEVEKIYKEAEMICREPKESLGASVSCVVRILKGYPEIKKKVLVECAPYVAEEEVIISETMSEAVPEGYGMRDIFCQGCRQDSKCLPYGTRLKIPKTGEGSGCKEECFECKGGCEINLKTGLEVCYEPPKECLEEGVKAGEKICKMVCSEQLLGEETPMYCSIDGTFKPQVEEGSECQNSYECLSNECSNGTCVSTYGLLQKIWAWLTRLFKIGE